MFCVLILPLMAQASHRSNSVNRSSLDDDIVDEIPIPILFGLEYEEINPDFSDPRGDGSRTHEGEDLLAPQGTPIVSPTKAIVISTGSGPSAGKYVYTANPGGETFRYMHLDYIADLDRGDKLDVGDFIGTVGDTGNAPDGVYHLHFEMRDEDNKPQDPFPRLTDEFSLKEKISFFGGVFSDVKNDDELAKFLVETYREDFVEAVTNDYEMPKVLKETLEEAGIYSKVATISKIEELMTAIPRLLTQDLRVGDSGAAVTLLQIFLLYMSEGYQSGNS